MNWHILNQWEQLALGIGCSLAAGLIGLLCKRLFGKKREVPRGAVQQNASPVITQTFQPTINIHLPIADSGETSQATQKRGEGKPTALLPHFEYKGPRERAIFINPDARYGITDPHDMEEVNHSNKALLLGFENAPHGKTARALEVIAKMSFGSSNDVREQSIDYGVWLNSPCNCTDMDVGDTRELVLLCELDGKLFSFDDRREEYHDFDSEGSWLHPRPVDSLESVKIRLIDKRTGTTETFSFRISYDAGHFNVAASQKRSGSGFEAGYEN